jgi:hypothetical protein
LPASTVPLALSWPFVALSPPALTTGAPSVCSRAALIALKQR